MPRIQLKSALTAFAVTLLLAIVALRFNAVGQAAYIAERVVLSVVDRQLPTPAEVDDLARVNRLVARKALPAVVHILTTSRPSVTLPPEGEYPDWLNQVPGWHEFSEEEKREWWRQRRRNLERRGRRPVRAQGSGVIIDARNGIILTNNHVVGNADEIEVRLHDGRRFEATVIGTDPPTDLAVIQIPAENLFELTIGDSDALQVGDPVMTIGNPFGYEGSVSKGIVSALDRAQVNLIEYEGFIQTDAVINPGNSGGPLVNMRAEIVGINTAIESTTGSFNGIGLAIPSARVQEVLPMLMQGEQIVRGFLGVNMRDVQNATQSAKKLGWDKAFGVIVSNVVIGSPVDEAGIQTEDILVNLDGVPIPNLTELKEKIAYTKPGDRIVLDIWRSSQLVSVEVVVGRRPQNLAARENRSGRRQEENPGDDAGNDALTSMGLDVQVLDEDLVRQYHLQSVASEGVVVTKVASHSAASSNDVKPGDLIVAVNGTIVRGLDHLNALLKSLAGEDSIDLRLRNRRGSRHVQLEPKP